jgi:hypothetical protein
LATRTQIHDFNPGIVEDTDTAADGLFWTIAIPRSSVSANPGAGRASLHLSNVEVEDYFDVVNALLDGPSVEADVSINAEWHDVLSHHNFRTPAAGFAGEYAHTKATVSWSASNDDGYNFVANPSSDGFAEVGTSRNGVFF